MIETYSQNGAGPEIRAPGVASGRSYLRSGLPAIYRDGGFGMRFLAAMEIVLDPVVALLDNLPSHFDPGHAPADILVLLSNWLGLEEYESRPMHERRELVRRAAELALKRGTKLGLELALELNFPDIPMRVEDGGGVQQSAEPEGGKASAPPGFVVYCDVPLEEAKQREIARFISRQKPAHVPFKLRVKAPRTGAKKA